MNEALRVEATMRILVLSAIITGAAFPLSAQSTVSIKTFAYSPDTVEVRAGSTVTWRNEDQVDHTVTADSVAASRLSEPLNGVLSVKGATYKATFAKPGVYAYYCDRHPFMRGAVRVAPSGDKP